MFLISLCAFFSFFLLANGEYRHQIVKERLYGFNNSWVYQPPKYILLGFLSVLVITSTVRYGFIDTYAYKIMYREVRNNWFWVDNPPWDVERLWMIFLYYLNFISDSPKLMLFISALIINGAFIYCIHHYSSDIVFSCFIYFCLSYLDTNNGLRQFVAAAFTMYLMTKLKQEKIFSWLFFIGGVGLAAQFHHSAWVVIPIVLCASGKKLNIKTIGVLIGGIVFLSFSSSISQFLFANSEGFKYQGYFENTAGMGVPRALINGVLPLYLCFYYYCKYKHKAEISRQESFLMNILVVNSVFVLAGLYMQYWVRLTFYTSFSLYAFMPKLIWIWTKDHASYWGIKFFACCCYLFFFCYNIYVNIAYGAIRDFRIEW